MWPKVLQVHLSKSDDLRIVSLYSYWKHGTPIEFEFTRWSFLEQRLVYVNMITFTPKTTTPDGFPATITQKDKNSIKDSSTKGIWYPLGYFY